MEHLNSTLLTVSGFLTSFILYKVWEKLDKLSTKQTEMEVAAGKHSSSVDERHKAQEQLVSALKQSCDLHQREFERRVEEVREELRQRWKPRGQ